MSEGEIQADLGALGQIDVTFRPSGQPRTEHSKCKGKPVTFDSGYYEGTISFHGEENFTAVEATRARGNLGFLLNLVCPGSSGVTVGGPAPHPPGAELDVYADGSRTGPRLKVVKNHPRAPAHFEAGVSERRGEIAIARFAGVVAPARAFTYDPAVRAATVRPPAPFAGAARFSRDRKSAKRWSGNLTVDFPGNSDVRLTGAHARVQLAHAHWAWNRAG